MLSGAESAALLSALAEDKSFKSNADAFSRAFPPTRRFTACCALAMLLEVGGVRSIPASHRGLLRLDISTDACQRGIRAISAGHRALLRAQPALTLNGGFSQQVSSGLCAALQSAQPGG
ncbi:unnamed protein product [Closterium sp. Naga37s-1]|nr:unnamed protein product [Closterium sp. Naga37s-1]